MIRTTRRSAVALAFDGAAAADCLRLEQVAEHVDVELVASDPERLDERGFVRCS